VRCSLLLTIVPCACPLRADHRPVYVHRPACPARASTEDTTTPSDEAESVGGTVGARDRPSAGACCWIAEHGTPRRPVRFALARRTVPVCRATSCLPVSSDHRRMCVHACTFSLSPVARHFFFTLPAAKSVVLLLLRMLGARPPPLYHGRCCLRVCIAGTGTTSKTDSSTTLQRSACYFCG
jgi:hypothetical protein